LKIAIIAPSPVPFTIGGAENLFCGLQRYINDETPHQCELIKLPSREHSFKELMQTYLEFCRLDLSHFDLVISTKYPAWMVRHSNHVCYMQHTLRGLYDTYHFTGLPETFAWEGAALAEVKDLMGAAQRSSSSNIELETLLEYLVSLEADQVPLGTLDFPGPFARGVVHFLDSIALSTSRITRHAAISENVRDRADYFPDDAKVRVVHHPPKLSLFHCGAQEYLFTVSRLDGPKRIALLVEAMRQVKAEIPLYIAGTGPDEVNIRALAAGDSRIKFLGFLNDQEVLGWYKDALAVPFVPYDEDYGLVTIEAMMSGKPVLTLTDSGGPNEFVESGVTGFSVAPTHEAVAAGIDALCQDKDAARQMGRVARERVSGITWAKVIDTLLGDKNLSVPPKVKRKPQIAVGLTFPVFPPRGGGQSRVFHLYRHLGNFAAVEMVTSCQPHEPAFHGEIAPGLVETRVPRSRAHQDAETEYSRSVEWVPVTDIVMSELYKLTPDFECALKRACGKADVVVASHPYLSGALQEFAPGKPLWFEAQDVEFSLKTHILPDTEAGRTLLEKVRQDEESCWRSASLVFACARRDIDELTKLYGESAANMLDVPNGVAIDDVPFVPLRARTSLRTRIGLGRGKTVLFMGSWHGPNLTAVRALMDGARALPNVTFLILVSVCQALVDVPVPENVRLLGVVDDAEKAVLLGSVDFCVNPMTTGSGSNLKMLDYFAAGTPVISTEFGARGIDAAADVSYLKISDDLGLAIQAACLKEQWELQQIADRARQLVEQKYAWNIIAREFAMHSGLDALANVGLRELTPSNR